MTSDFIHQEKTDLGSASVDDWLGKCDLGPLVVVKVVLKGTKATV